MKPAGGWSDSLAGRMMLLLTFAMIAASFVSFFIADRVRMRDFRNYRLLAVALSTADIAERLGHDETKTMTQLRQNRIYGVRLAPAGWTQGGSSEFRLDRMLAERMGPQAHAAAVLIPWTRCFSRDELDRRPAGISTDMLPDCWFVTFTDPNGLPHRLAFDQPPLQFPHDSTLAPLFLLSVIVLSASLSFVVTRLATRPLRRLTQAARAFSVTTDPELLPELGPSEIRAALQTFNLMQVRVRKGFRDRTQLLASITHDLQTPLTRLRLLLEHIPDEDLRARLVDEVAGMGTLVKTGLELARSAENREAWSMVDIDSLLSSTAEDAAEFGQNVHFTGGVGARARVKLGALQRCINNLVENALKYAGSAELSCRRDGQGYVIEVRDHGPGIPAHAIDDAMQPFVSLHEHGGTGIGLAIVQSQAANFGASLQLYNHPEGGLVAALKLRGNS